MEKEIILCEFCEVRIKDKYIQSDKNIAYCSNCHRLREIKKITIKEVKKKIKTLKPPKGIYIKDSNNELLIKVPFRRFEGIIYILSSVLSYFLYLASNANVNHDAPSYYFKIIWIFSITIFYIGLVKLFNSTIIKVNDEEITMSSAPLPHFFTKDYKSEEIKQLFVKESIGRNRYYYLNILFEYDNSSETILTLQDGQYILYLERVMEDWLEIEDQEVLGEYKDNDKIYH